jgi:hypothetical protein
MASSLFILSSLIHSSTYYTITPWPRSLESPVRFEFGRFPSHSKVGHSKIGEITVGGAGAWAVIRHIWLFGWGDRRWLVVGGWNQTPRIDG